MKNWKFPLISTLLLLLAINVHAAPVELDRVVAIVDEGVVLQSDIDTSLKTVKINAQEKGQPLPDEAVLREQVLEKLIVDTIQSQQAEKMGIRIDDTRLEAALNDIAKENNMTLAQLQQKTAAQGLPYANFREQIRKEIAASEARNAQVRRRINILPQEVESLAQLLAEETQATVQYKISHIQLRAEDGATQTDKEALEKQAEDLTERLKQGADFATMAYTYSKGPKALQGGDWGWMRKEEMPTIFADQITGQGKNSIIGPFRSGVGFHILKIDDVKGLETVAVTEVNARHILIKTSVIMSDEGAQRLLNTIIDDIKSGKETFADMAQRYSQDPGSAANDGELGFQTPDLYVPEFKHQVETLPVGQISAPFKTVHGWHIAEVLERRQVDRTDAAMKNKAYRILLNRKFNEEAGAWLQEIRASAYVEILQDDDGENDNE
ncbi:peptidylprolyl isomerase SurA [Aliivibrio fischeri]|uniref:peptidylprolyl isomerase SurA n=1 Tax=Aliivibrio fischeri TaxID=668 RepID=UPI0012D89929|nr:peptidylprolyl isomerase SurA [Aliivibrio fischeri]MUK63648.1 peptidylprolyl isomerase SurA [Aliivibrio fischeri]MUL22449.1 peptidylprolyl isomerase SurA [Aliivibrio fischeri]MUL26615.1 peptidylprolyl isomerase SurA [Aliivibrio fischeri]